MKAISSLDLSQLEFAMGKFDTFEIISTDYKVVAGQGIALDLLIPPNLTAGLHPIIVRFHGGGYVCHFQE
jgi:acetyl esterase/lipase